MERYSHLQSMPNSPLTPLTPLSENTKFKFNFGGDGSLDMYIDSVRQEHRVEQQQKKLLQHANRIFHKKNLTLSPKRYSEEFLKLRDVFETQGSTAGKNYSVQRVPCQLMQLDSSNAISKTAVVQMTYKTNTKNTNYDISSKLIRTPLKPKNHNVRYNTVSKPLNIQQQQQNIKKMLQKHIVQPNKNLKLKRNRPFHQTSPVAVKPLCPQVTNILQRNGLSTYCGLFQREEIDLFAFHLLTFCDLHEMGITNQRDCTILMREIYYAGQYLKNNLEKLSKF